MKADDPWARRFAETPLNRTMEMSLVDRGSGWADLELPDQERFVQEAGVVHGGVTSTLADSAAAYALAPCLSEGETMIGVEFKMQFLHAAQPGSGALRARGSVLRQGSRLGVCEADVHQGERHIARGSFTDLIIRSG